MPLLVAHPSAQERENLPAVSLGPSQPLDGVADLTDMVQIIHLEHLRANRPAPTLRVKLRFANQAGEQLLALNADPELPHDPDGVLERLLTACGLLQEPPRLGCWHPIATQCAQDLLQSPEHEQALQYMMAVGIPQPLSVLYQDAAEEFVALRDLEQLMMTSKPALSPVIFRMVRAGCRNVSKRLTTKLVNHPDYAVWFTPSTCPDHTPKGPRILEHCVPLSPIHERILGQADSVRGVHCRDHHGHLAGAAEIAAFLAEQFTVAFVTASEDRKLRPAHRMPDAWDWDHPDKMLRYKGAEPVPHFRRVRGQPCSHCQADA